jgi:homoserine dehydrogenase
MEHTIALLGFGNVLRAFAALLLRKQADLQSKYDVRLKVVGIITQSKGYVIQPDGIDLNAALACVKRGNSLTELHQDEPIAGMVDFIQRVPAQTILEGTWLNPHDGQPATDYLRAALLAGKNVVTANKGPIAFAYRELDALAKSKGLGFFFESTVMDGCPLHVIAREGLLGLEITRIRGILNSTTNSILTRLEEGKDFQEAVIEMQHAGLAEADPSNDVDGWDAAVKITVLANVVMGADLRPADVEREGIRHITIDTAQQALREGKRVKLLCEAIREGNKVQARVKPTALPLSDPLATVSRTAGAVSFDTDVLPHVTIIEGESSPTTTAYGMLADTLNIIRGRR